MARSDPQQRAPLTPAVFHILLALVEGPLHGYGIMKRAEQESGLAMGPGTIYGSLDRLAEAEWVREVDPPQGDDGRRSRCFELTPEGVEALRGEAARISRLAALESVRDLAPEVGS